MQSDWRHCLFQTAKLHCLKCTCAFHTWLQQDRHSKNTEIAEPITPPELSTILSAPHCFRDLRFKTISPLSPLYAQNVRPPAVQNGHSSSGTEALWNRHKRIRTESRISVTMPLLCELNPNVGEIRLARFIEVVTLLGKAPWANMTFSINEDMLRRLIASHLPLIIGVSAWENEKASLYPIIDATTDLSNTQNVVWITNRQQGKTSTLAKFLAAMSFMSPAGGNLFCVYSTNLDRAQELTRAAKKYLYWLTSDKPIQTQLTLLGVRIPIMTQDNERAYTVTGQYESVVNTVIARPKSADSCRGDAPKAAIFDEIGFVSADFWYKFAYPLLQISKRVFTCATTPAPSGSFFSVFADNVIARNAENDFFFRLINHSLVCATCYDDNQAEKCVHKLGLIPPWKSLLRFTQMKRLVPAKRMGDYQAEVFGVMQPEGSRYFPAKIVDSIFLRRALLETNPIHLKKTRIFVAIDPASHHRSCMGISALLYGAEGQLVFLGLASVGVQKCEAMQIKIICGSFIHRLARHPWIRQRCKTTQFYITPIIECNNNEVLAQSILDAIGSAAGPASFKIENPFQKEYFGTDISENLGVWTTERNKLASIQQLYGAMLDGRVFLAMGCITIGEVYRATNTPPSIQSQRDLVAAQLKNFRDLPNGKVSGKDANTEDDLAMSVLINAYWSYCIRATMASGNLRMGI